MVVKECEKGVFGSTCMGRDCDVLLEVRNYAGYKGW